jgi:CHAT domain-containing protein/tetratricopeptide (TPR) repeat protein
MKNKIMKHHKLYTLVLMFLISAMMGFAQQEMDKQSLLEKSDVLFSKGVELYNQRKYADAIPLFTESDKIDKSVLDPTSNRRDYSAMWLASCYYNLKDTMTAANLFPEYFMLPPIDRRLTVESDSLSNLGILAFEKNDLENAIKYISECAKIEKRQFGECVFYLASLSKQAFYNWAKGNYREAIFLAIEALNVHEKILGKNRQSYGILLNNVATYYSSLGNYNEAIRLGTEALKYLEHFIGKNHPDYATLLSNLAAYNSNSGNYIEAIRLSSESLKIREQVIGKDNTDYAMSLNNLATYYSRLGNYNDAIHLDIEALNIIERVLGKNSPGYATYLDNIAFYNWKLGKYDEAIRLGTEALSIREQVLGKYHPDYAISLNNLANYNSSLGNYNEAIHWGTEALKIRERVLGKVHPDYAITLGNLASYYSALGNYSEAIRLGAKVLNILEQVLGKNHPNYATSLNNLARYNSDLGNFVEAIRLETEALKIREQVFGKAHSDYITSLSNLAIYNWCLGNYSEAVSLHTEAVRISEKVLGKSHPDYAILLSNLAKYNSDLGDYNEAIRLETEALKIREQVLGKDHPYYANSLNNLSVDYLALGNYNEAIRLGIEAQNIYKKILGESHPAYAKSLNNLASYNLVTARLPEAGNYYIEYLSVAKDVIGRNITDLTREEKSLYWSKYENEFLNRSPFMTYKIPSKQLTDASYSGLLFSKGLLLNAETELRKILLEHGDENVAKVYDELSTNRRILRKLYEQPISERKLSTDSLNNIVTQLERQLISISKEYGDYTKNLRIERKDVQAKLSKDDIAVEFASFNYNDTTFYCAYLLKKDYEVPKMTVCLKTTTQINAPDVYVNSNLSKAIWGSIADDLVGVKNIYFGPSGELYNIAIESLPDWEDPTRLVSDRWNFYRLSSTRELAVIKDKNQIKQSVVYGGLTYDTDIASMNRDKLRYPEVERDFSAYMPSVTDSLNLRSGVDDLPGTKVEAKNIDAKLKAVRIHDIIRTDSIGTEASFKALSGQKKNLLHIATHGFYWTEREARRSNLGFLSFNYDDKRYKEDKALTRSGLLFAGANNALEGKALPKGVDDGILTAQEIAQLDLRGLDLVVLSACQTGLGEITGDGVFGLQRGFKKAGAQSILMSLWKVDDAATQMLMTQFYTNLTSGMTKRRSLLEAQRYVREYETGETTASSQKVHPYSNPKYWAAFVLLDAVE